MDDPEGQLLSKNQGRLRGAVNFIQQPPLTVHRSRDGVTGQPVLVEQVGCWKTFDADLSTLDKSDDDETLVRRLVFEVKGRKDIGVVLDFRHFVTLADDPAKDVEDIVNNSASLLVLRLQTLVDFFNSRS